MTPSKHPVLRIPLTLFGVLAIGWLISVGGVAFWGTRDRAQPSDVIVVLGAAQYAGRPSPVLKARLDHALGLWQQGLAPRVILTGGTGSGDTTSEAAVGRIYMMRRGIPDSVIMLENQGRSTDESLSGVASLMQAQRLVHAILVSDPFHMLRLQILSWRYGLHAVPSPTRTSPISANRLEALVYILSESVKVPLTAVLAFSPVART
jgi:uncharacterized SAM-binding protein YcdF (DUF218 family)